MNNASNRFHAVSFTFILGFTVGLNALAEAQDQETPVKASVCDVLGRLSYFNGKRVIIRAPIGQGNLYSNECKIELKTGKYKWPNEIVLTDPKSFVVRPEHRSVNQTKISQSDANQLYNTHIPPGSVKLLTVVGVIETRPLALIGPDRDQPTGYGHLNLVPAQLIVEEIRDVEIISQQVKQR